MWKRAFMLLLTINILMFAAPAAWYLSLPRLKTPQSIAAFNPNTTVNVNVDVGANAVNKYLEAAIKEKPDVSRVLSYANVHFQDNWNCDIGIKLDNRVAPFNVTFDPSVKNGDLDLQILDATMNGTQMTSTLEAIFGLLPLPSWVTFNAVTNTLQINLPDLPENKVKVQAVDYSKRTHLFTVRLGTVPKL